MCVINCAFFLIMWLLEACNLWNTANKQLSTDIKGTILALVKNMVDIFTFPEPTLWSVIYGPAIHRSSDK